MASEMVLQSAASETYRFGVDFWDLSMNASTFRMSRSISFMRRARYFGLISTVIYLVAIFSIQKIMARRRPFQLTGLLAVWNLGLAIFSAVGFWVVGVATWEDVQRNGLSSVFCEPYRTRVFRSWAGYYQVLFVVSKVVEFGDTLFIVLRKRPLIFLHWYHHILTMNYCCWTYETMKGIHLYIGLVNFAIHSVMYTYYFMRAARLHVPSWVAPSLTSAQIAQFIFSIGTQGYAYWLWKYDGCHRAVQFPQFTICLLMELSYVLLFGHFFYNAYYVRKPGQTSNGSPTPDKLAANEPNAEPKSAPTNRKKPAGKLKAT